ncbi:MULTISPECIES: hypothetical protein [Leuconostoc]|jgi:hypothetical protein|uniref:Uncharacterized protein n=1 Tax=Leuconostoc gelidum subsp. gelidum TaxID=1607839 RepID=A0ABS7V3I9_LEUGE|nr:MULTISPECIES: hypothetical protein [Leuconostoc]AFS40168.1 hypothetical protein C269_03625 [Leuconostoc gelidum JB7]MBZ5964321.1 hypothetical protein [Leuconostoc gelidum subsp. gelidum]MBZ5975080.1 hypothetical protein [Leuconostoc gelidum subsp. gelidum]MBZ5976970.1 hypothetical protein [Leuconostoc gelidum subsp. gelidum]MBZ5978083.1 hypothetical protein [Leuconostoc gelidum subsp. gelidum]
MQIYDSKVIQIKLSAAEQQAGKIAQELQSLQKADSIDNYMQQQIKTLENQLPNLKLIIIQLKKQLISAKKSNQKTNTQHFVRSNNHRNDL